MKVGWEGVNPGKVAGLARRAVGWGTRSHPSSVMEKTLQKFTEKQTKIIKKSKNIYENSFKIEVRRGPGGSWEGSWAHSGPQGCPMDENGGKRA